MVIELRPIWRPSMCARASLKLARGRLYDGIVFHRVIEGFMAQTGDPHGHRHRRLGACRTCRPSSTREPHVRGICSMARTSDPNSANSQFFICFDDAHFPATTQYHRWGQAIDGMENVDKIKRGEPVQNPTRSSP